MASFSFPRVLSHDPNVVSQRESPVLCSTISHQSRKVNAKAVYEENLLQLINEKMDKRFFAAGLVGANDPWPLFHTLEEEYRKDLPTSPSFIALQESLGSKEDEEARSQGFRAVKLGSLTLPASNDYSLVEQIFALAFDH
jgi:hypothetical protein